MLCLQSKKSPPSSTPFTQPEYPTSVFNKWNHTSGKKKNILLKIDNLKHVCQSKICKNVKRVIYTYKAIIRVFTQWTMQQNADLKSLLQYYQKNRNTTCTMHCGIKQNAKWYKATYLIGHGPPRKYKHTRFPFAKNPLQHFFLEDMAIARLDWVYETVIFYNSVIYNNNTDIEIL